MGALPIVDWGHAQRALERAVHQVTGLLRTLPATAAPALGQWDTTEVAVHLSQAWQVVPGLARGGLREVRAELPGLGAGPDESLIAELADLSTVTVAGVASDPERDPRVLADRIEARAAEFFTSGSNGTAEDDRPWLVAGVRVPRSVLTCHLLNETVVHGYDIARAAGRPWPIDPAAASMIITGFLMPVLACVDPRALVRPAGAKVRATYDLRVRGGDRFTLAFHDGALRVGGPSQGPVDCRLSVEPVSMLLVVWGRRNQWQAVARGHLLSWGRRPWLGPRLRQILRNP